MVWEDGGGDPASYPVFDVIPANTAVSAVGEAKARRARRRANGPADVPALGSVFTVRRPGIQ